MRPDVTAERRRPDGWRRWLPWIWHREDTSPVEAMTRRMWRESFRAIMAEGPQTDDAGRWWIICPECGGPMLEFTGRRWRAHCGLGHDLLGFVMRLADQPPV
jgi:hypothetical protein